MGTEKKNLNDLGSNDQNVECIETDSDELNEEILLNRLLIMGDNHSNLYDQKQNILLYIAGFVVKKISAKVFCIFCKISLVRVKTDRNNYSHNAICRY